MGSPAWPEAWVQALSDASLRQTSSAAIFQRGKAYAAAAAVTVTDEDLMPEPALRARVDGTQTYSTEVWIEDDAVAGSCDCPNAADGWFCKHQVALALVWRDRQATDAAPAAPSPPAQAPAHRAASQGTKRSSTALEKRQALHDFLHSQEPAILVDKLLELADRDPSITRALQQWHNASTVGKDLVGLKRLISEMLAPGSSFIAWNRSASYVAQASATLPLLQQARTQRATAAVALCLHALHCVWAVLQQADDSDGEIGGLCTAIGDEWVLCLQAAGPQKAAFGDTYLQLQLDDPFGCFDAVAAEAALGEPAMARYRCAIAERWRQAKDAVRAAKAEHAARFAKRKGHLPSYEGSTEREVNLFTLERLHLAQLEATGQVDQALAVLREDLSDADAHSKLIAHLEAHHRFSEAFAQAQQACQTFPTDWRLQDDVLRCYEREGCTTEALALRRQQFERNPGLDRYLHVLQAGQAAGRDVVALRQLLLDLLAERELQMQAHPLVSPHAGAAFTLAAKPARDVSLRAQVLCSEARWAEANALVQPPAVCREAVLSQIARHLPPDQADQALALWLRVLASKMQHASSPYRDELALVTTICQRMDPAQRAAWLAQWRVDYKAKRNFIRGLPTH